ncbi:MAG: histidinol dehydrogenase, partial [Desulfobacterales bacterium]|nr:histidinol dehydrogenase [Desulfobacterales bacterium]
EISAALKQVGRPFVRSLNKAIRQIESFHRQQLPKSWMDTRREGTLLGQIVHPVEVAGIYVPGAQGGTTPLVSSVLMGALPARIAGVKEIVMVTPSKKDGSIDPHLLVAAKKVGIKSVFKIGSAWAIGALAYGTQSIPRADVIVGPGNMYVTLAKKIVSGTVGIDMIAGPSEILIIADETADPVHLAADMLSQAEHDVLASSVLLTTSREIAAATANQVQQQLSQLTRKEIARASIKRFGTIVVVPDIRAAVDIANEFAPEHLELMVKEPFEVVGSLKNAGAIFMGAYTPEPVGDYIAGPNHVLPTAGTARFSSALSVETFIKKTSLIQYSRKAFQKDAADIIRLANIEGLDAHANAVQVRLKK